MRYILPCHKIFPPVKSLQKSNIHGFHLLHIFLEILKILQLFLFCYCVSNIYIKKKKKKKKKCKFKKLSTRVSIEVLIKRECTALLFYNTWLSASFESCVQCKQLLIHIAMSCCMQHYFAHWRSNLEHCNLHDQLLCWLESNN